LAYLNQDEFILELEQHNDVAPNPPPQNSDATLKITADDLAKCA